MREKILAQLISKFAGVSKQALGLIADKLAKKVTEESGIEQAITDLDNAISITDFAADLQKEGDRRVTDAKKEWDKKKPTPAKDKTEESADDPKPPSGEDAPAWAKALSKQVESLLAEKVQGSIRSKVAEKLKDKVPEKFYVKWALPDKEEDIETFITTVEKDWSEFKQEQVNAGLMTATTPAGGTGTAGKGPADAKVESDIKAWAEKNKKKAEVNTKQSQTT